MRVVITHPGELGAAEVAAWHAMQQATPSLANPFLAAEFAAAAGRLRREAQLAVLMDGQSVVGFFPFERRRLGAGVPIGGWLTPSQGLIHVPGLDWSPRELLRGCQLSAWRFDNLIADQHPFRPYYAAIEASPTIDLADGFAPYYASLWARSPRFCREIARKTRKLAREVGEVRVVADSQDPAVLRTLMEWKSEQYRRTGCVDRFAHPWVTDLLSTLLATRTDCVRGMLSVLYAGGRPIAIQFGLRAGTLLVGWFTGYDIRYRRFSPGMIHLIQLSAHLPSVGVRVLQMGKGAKAYTDTVKNSDIFVAEGVVTNQSVLGAAHWVRSASTRWAERTVRQHPGLHRAADQVLRHGGVARRTYGRI